MAAESCRHDYKCLRLSPQGHFRFYGRAKLSLKTRSPRRRFLEHQVQGMFYSVEATFQIRRRRALEVITKLSSADLTLNRKTKHGRFLREPAVVYSSPLDLRAICRRAIKRCVSRRFFASSSPAAASAASPDRSCAILPSRQFWSVCGTGVPSVSG